ncbi:MAG: hypothetical protein E7538_09720 [Ruminococcaceae bacterium]|nr:hypothetical protein [Oscillospiraceae bacterium]
MKDTESLLKECDAGTKTAVNSIKEVLDNIESEELLRLLTNSLDEHEDIGNEIAETLRENGCRGKDPNPMARVMSWMKINFKMLEKGDDKTVAALMLDGCNMGVKQLSAYINEYGAADDKSKRLAKRLINCEEKLAKELKNYL